jgi:hypothetical protein
VAKIGWTFVTLAVAAGAHADTSLPGPHDAAMQQFPTGERGFAEPDPRVEWIIDVELPGWVDAERVNAALDFPNNGGTTLVEVVGVGHEGWTWIHAWGEKEYRKLAVVQHFVDGDHPVDESELQALYRRVVEEAARIGGRAKPRSSPQEGAARAARLAAIKRECAQPLVLRVDGDSPMEVEEMAKLLGPEGFELERAERLDWRDRTISPRYDRRILVRRRGPASWRIEFTPALTWEPMKGYEKQLAFAARIAERFHGRILDGDGQPHDPETARARVARVPGCIAEVGIEPGGHASWMAF